MSFLSGKKLLLLGFVVVLLVAIPVTVYLVQQQQKIKSGATAATTLSFSPAAPQTTTVGSTVSFDIYLDPSNVNQINYVQLVIGYDATKLATIEAGIVPDLWPAADGGTFTPSVSLQPTYTPDTVSVGWSNSPNFQNVIKTRTKIGTVTFKAIAPTDTGAATQILFQNGSQAQSNESAALANVISNLNSIASVNITDTATPTVTLTSTPTPTPTTNPTTAVTGSPTPIPLCSNFTIDGATTGTVPYSVNFTLTGASPDSTSISKVLFDFGDGETHDASDSANIGTNSISIATSHTYQTSGTFNATAALTEQDADGVDIKTENCTPIAITVNDVASPTATTVIAQNPSPLPPTGPTGILTIGAIGVILTFIGAVLLLAL